MNSKPALLAPPLTAPTLETARPVASGAPILRSPAPAQLLAAVLSLLMP